MGLLINPEPEPLRLCVLIRLPEVLCDLKNSYWRFILIGLFTLLSLNIFSLLPLIFESFLLFDSYCLRLYSSYSWRSSSGFRSIFVGFLMIIFFYFFFLNCYFVMRGKNISQFFLNLNLFCYFLIFVFFFAEKSKKYILN